MNADKAELTKKDKVNRFLYKCGVLWNNEKTEFPPDITAILESLQHYERYDVVLALVKSEQFGIDRKLKAISHTLEVEEEKLPTIKRRMMDKISHDATINVWDYILRVARREDWKDYTWEGYQDLLTEEVVQSE